MDELSAYLGRVEEMVAWARPHEFELAFVNTATGLSFPGVEVASRLGIPTIWAIHESFDPAIIWGPLDPEVRLRAEGALSEVAFAVFEAEATQRIFAPLLDGDSGRTIPYGLDLEPIAAKRASFDNAAARRQAGVPEDAQLLVCIGTVEPRKAQIPLAQAFELIAERHPKAQLAFVGGKASDPHCAALEECIAASSHASQMRVIPITPDVDPWYGMADLLVCASDIESLPRTVLEAMAWETPVLATSVFGLPELITDGETGWLCEPRDLSALAAGIDRALSTPVEVHDRIALAARELVEQRHSLSESQARSRNCSTAPGRAPSPGRRAGERPGPTTFADAPGEGTGGEPAASPLRSWLDPAGLRAAILLALVATLANGIWILIDHTAPSWDQAHYLDVTWHYQQAHATQGLTGLVQSIHSTDPGHGPLFTVLLLPFF